MSAPTASEPGELAYLDSSAFYKLVSRERETDVLRDYLGAWPLRTSSLLLRLEVVRAALRLSPEVAERGRQALAGVRLIPPDDAIWRAAESLEPPALRALDALHVATALSLAPHLGVIVTYDRRMLEAARRSGLPVTHPGAPLHVE